MVLDFGKLNSGASTKQTDPRKIFTTLSRHHRFKRPSDEQGDVLDLWFGRRKSKNLTLKMNTGGGKTVIGLLCLQSSLNEGVKPAVYVTPDVYLSEQVLQEAKDLGIVATDDERNSDFLAGRAILVVNIYKLINGRSVFGVGDEGRKIPIGAIIIDDAHACLSTATEQFTIKSGAGTQVYDKILEIFEDDLKNQSPSTFLDVSAQDPQAVMSIPYWAWQSKSEEVLKLLHANRNTRELEWQWPLLKEIVPLCSCAIGGGKLEISPRFIPIDRIPSFDQAERRIYMTATLADDTILVSNFKADVAEVSEPIRPKGGGDIGDRMILIPQEINPAYTNDEMKAFLGNLASTANVVVIVPSRARAAYWSDLAAQTLDKDSIEEGVKKLRAGHIGLSVLINKYDGIDLPGRACEVLVIDGLPEVHGLIERVDMAQLEGTRPQLIRQVQRIEQGMGRGVRSSDDYCVVFLLGPRLTQRLHAPEAMKLFSPATRAQIELGNQVAEQIRGKPIADLLPIINLCLARDIDWVRTGRNAVVNAVLGANSNIDDATVAQREAFDAARINTYDSAIDKLQIASNNALEKKAQGYLKQQLATYVNFVDQSKAQEIQLSALTLNSRVLRPIQGISYQRVRPPSSGQAVESARFMKKRFLEGNDLVIWVNAILDELRWGKEHTKRFEGAIRDVGRLLGFSSQTPEADFGRGPDNLWAMGELSYLVIECKSGATDAPAISKSDTNQLNGSIVWFKKQYDSSCLYTPVMIHMQTKFENAASPDPEIRIMDETGLARLKIAIKDFATALASGNSYVDPMSVKRQLTSLKLDREQIVKHCTSAMSRR